MAEPDKQALNKYPVIKKYREDSQAMFAGLMAVAMASLAILAGKSDLDLPLTVGIYCFALSIPCLAFCSERVRIDKQYRYRTHSMWIDLIEGCGIFGCLIGFGAIFWHFSLWAALLFGASCFAANALNLWYTDAMEKLNENEPPPDSAKAEQDEDS